MHNPEKSDIFSLGVTMLSACTNTDFRDFYKFDLFSFNYNFALQKLIEVEAWGYSKLFVKCIGNLLMEKESGRPSAYELIQFIDVNSDDDFSSFNS